MLKGIIELFVWNCDIQIIWNKSNICFFLMPHIYVCACAWIHAFVCVFAVCVCVCSMCVCVCIHACVCMFISMCVYVRSVNEYMYSADRGSMIDGSCGLAIPRLYNALLIFAVSYIEHISVCVLYNELFYIQLAIFIP